MRDASSFSKHIAKRRTVRCRACSHCVACRGSSARGHRRGRERPGTLASGGSPPIARVTLQRAVPITPADRTGAYVDYFPFRTAFPTFRPGRHPHYGFRGLLRLHSRYGPLDRSTASSGLCHQASAVRLPVQATRQLPDQSTTLWAEPSPTGDTRVRGAPKRSQFSSGSASSLR